MHMPPQTSEGARALPSIFDDHGPGDTLDLDEGTPTCDARPFGENTLVRGYAGPAHVSDLDPADLDPGYFSADGAPWV